jgi:hypothetical protein
MHKGQSDIALPATRYMNSAKKRDIRDRRFHARPPLEVAMDVGIPKHDEEAAHPVEFDGLLCQLLYPNSQDACSDWNTACAGRTISENTSRAGQEKTVISAAT